MRTACALMVMPRSRSRSMASSTWACISRAVSDPVSSSSRSASVDLPWSMWAMIAKLRMNAASMAAGGQCLILTGGVRRRTSDLSRLRFVALPRSEVRRLTPSSNSRRLCSCSLPHLRAVRNCCATQAFRSSCIPPTFLNYRNRERARAIARNAWRERRRRLRSTSIPARSFLGADTIVVVDGEMLASLATKPTPVRMLHLLSGRTDQVITGVCLAGTEEPGTRNWKPVLKTHVPKPRRSP